MQQYNFDWVCQHEDAYSQLLKSYRTRGQLMAPALRLMIQHNLGEVSDADYNKTIADWSRNSYRDEWEDLMLHNRLQQQYNLAIRTKGKYLNSSVIVDWKGDNTSMKNQYDNTLSLQYVGKLEPAKWVDMDFGVTLNNNRTKSHAYGIYDYSKVTSFYDYQSMYNADGTPATLQASCHRVKSSLSLSLSTYVR